MSEWTYADRILYVDLTTGLSWAEPTSLELKREFVGGAGFVARLLAEAEGSAIAMAAGPLSDQMSGRLSLGAAPGASPRVGAVAVSSMGGRMAGALKGAGYDAIVMTGQSETPVYLVVDEEGAEIVPAGNLWGRDILAAEADLLSRFSGFAAIVAGPAAEERLSNATLAHEGHYCGGGGVGAGFGTARLKALLLRDRVGSPGKCTGCTLQCPARHAPEAARANLLGLDLHPADRRRRGPGVADLLGICQRTFQERPGGVLRDALSATMGLLAQAM